MTFLINLGDKFKINPNIKPDGSVILANSITMHTLERRKFNHPHLKNRYFDPQLYMAGLDPIQSSRYCARLASYPWFGIELQEYDSDKQVQRSWLDDVESKISDLWKRNTIDVINGENLAIEAIQECIDFQMRIGCNAIILPSPLTYDFNTDYSVELRWLDIGLEYIKKGGISLPIFATIALTDNCLRYSDPVDNSLLSIILDSVGARKIDGAYIVIEQNSESNLTRHISNTRVLWSALHMTHVFKKDIGIKVGVNFFGAFGLVLEAVGADFWASGWYKSHYRLRLADKLGGGPAYPSCWASKLLTDIHVEEEFDKLVKVGAINKYVERTVAIDGLLEAVKKGISSNLVPAWQYSPSNITAAKEHFLESIIIAEKDHANYIGLDRLNFIEKNWLTPASNNCKDIQIMLGSKMKTNTEHVHAWLDSIKSFRRDHNL